MKTILGVLSWQPLDTAPRDGTLFDIRRDGIRYTDCHFDSVGALVREHGYPSLTTVFYNRDGIEWMPRPDGLIAPYEKNAKGRQYVP